MKHFVLLLAMTVAIAGCATAEDAAKPAATPIELVQGTGVDDALAKRVQEWAQVNLAVAMPLSSTEAKDDERLDDVGLRVAKTLKPGSLGAVVLAWPGENHKEQGVLLAAQHVAVINVRAMKTADADDETVGRRVERQVMHSIGMLAGMDPCPNPLCVLSTYKTLQEIDNAGRNYCPPCLMKYQQKMHAQGIHTDASSPFNVMGTSVGP